MANNTLTGSLNPSPGFVVTPGQGNSGIITRLNPNNRYEVKVDQIDGYLNIQEPLTVKNGVGTVLPVRLTELIDVNTAVLTDGSVLTYNANTTFFDFQEFSSFDDLTVANTLTINVLSANGSIGADGQVLYSNGSSAYWGDQISFPTEIDGGILP